MSKKINIQPTLLLVFSLFIFLTNGCDKDKVDPNIVIDIDGNIYHTVTIGNQVWMVENLKTTRYNDGTAIPNVTDSVAWRNLNTPAYCWYNNDEAAYKEIYGALYNWYAVNTQKLCPRGWHVPTKAEWDTLMVYLGGVNLAGGKMKETGFTHWLDPNSGATNESGFTALPGGIMIPGGKFRSITQEAFFWSSTEFDSNSAWDYSLIFSSAPLFEFNPSKKGGESIRCMKD